MVAAISVCLSIFDMSAVPISTDLAEKAVRTWLHAGDKLGMRTSGEIDSVKVFATSNGAAFTVVRLRDSGFVVTSNDTEIEPIIAFSTSSDFEESSHNPLWVLLDRDIASRSRNRKSVAYANPYSAGTVKLSASAAKWARLTQGASLDAPLRESVAYASPASGTFSDVRVKPFLETKWAQDGPCFNYTTIP